MRAVAITKIFPNHLEPGMAPFNRQQFAALSRLCQLEVLAPVPYVPGARALDGHWAGARLAPVVESEIIDGVPVHHPRVLHVPRLDVPISWALLAAALAGPLHRRRRQIDVLLACWAYPDAVATVALGGWLDLPVVVVAIGSDVNVLAHRTSTRTAMRLALPRAERVLAVSRPLVRALQALGVPAARTGLLPTGVDRALFQPRSREEARRRLGLPEVPTVLFVGRLEEAKGVPELLQAFRKVLDANPDASLLLVGDGPLASRCAIFEERTGGRVRAVGARALEEVPWWIAAADIVCLPSHAEGTPNIVLESIACGRRVVATAVGGIPDVLDRAELGELVAPGDGDGLAAALLRGLQTPYVPEAVAALPLPTWDASAAVLFDTMQRAVQDAASARELRAGEVRSR